MIIPNIEKLYEPYSKTASLNDTIVWLRREATGLKIEPETVDEAIASVFLEMSRGKMFSKDGRKLGFGKDHAHAELNHYLLTKCRELNAEKVSIYLKLYQDRINSLILNHINADNKAYITEFTSTNISPPSTEPPKINPVIVMESVKKVGVVEKTISKISKTFSKMFDGLIDWSKSPILRRVKWTGLQ